MNRSLRCLALTPLPPANPLALPSRFSPLTNVTFEGTLNFGPASASNSTLTINGGTFVPAGSNTPSGVLLTSWSMSMTGTTMTGYQLAINDTGAALTLRGTTLTGFTQAGVYLASGTLDLGTASSPGNNKLTAPVVDFNHFGLYDNRGATGVPATTSSATSFSGTTPQPGTVATGPTQVAGEYTIATTGVESLRCLRPNAPCSAKLDKAERGYLLDLAPDWWAFECRRTFKGALRRLCDPRPVLARPQTPRKTFSPVGPFPNGGCPGVVVEAHRSVGVCGEKVKAAIHPNLHDHA
jgi:hypothetical protein